MDLKDIKNIRTKFNRDGYYHIENFLTEDESNLFREEVEKKNSNNIESCNNFINSFQDGKNVLSRAIDLVEKVFGKKYFFTGESHCAFNEKTSARIWHRDTKLDHFSKMDFNENYIIRFGIYLGNHKDFSYGTKFIPGSHKKTLYRFWDKNFYFKIKDSIPRELIFYLKRKKILNFKFKNLFPIIPIFHKNLGAKKGDLVFWNMRTVHAGNFLRLKFLKKTPLPICIEKLFLLPYLKNLILDDGVKRAFCGFSLGLKGDIAKNYISNRVEKGYVEKKFLDLF